MIALYGHFTAAVRMQLFENNAFLSSDAMVTLAVFTDITLRHGMKGAAVLEFESFTSCK